MAEEGGPVDPAAWRRHLESTSASACAGELSTQIESCSECLSEGRLQKAETLLEERRRRSQDLGLLDCLQFSDRGQIVLRNEALRQQAGYVSRSRGEQTVKELEALRNNLAHSQDIIACDWDIIVKLTEHLDKFLGSPV